MLLVHWQLSLSSNAINKHPSWSTLQVYPEESLRRIGFDVYSTLSLSYTDAILGTQMDVQTLRGITTVQIQPGTQPGATVTLLNQGVQVWGAKSLAFGAHYLTVKVLLPKSCTQGEQELLGQLKSIAGTVSAC